MTEKPHSRISRREVDNTRVFVTTLRGHLAAEGIEFHAETGNFGSEFAKAVLEVVAGTAAKYLEAICAR